MDQIRNIMDANGGNLEHGLVVPRARGQVRLIVRCRNNLCTCWSMAIILNSKRFNGRIDCIDWESQFVATDGQTRTGFHRHAWDAKKGSCERSKVALRRFQPRNVEQFIVEGLTLLGVSHKVSPPGGFII